MEPINPVLPAASADAVSLVVLELEERLELAAVPLSKWLNKCGLPEDTE